MTQSFLHGKGLFKKRGTSSRLAGGEKTERACGKLKGRTTTTVQEGGGELAKIVGRGEPRALLKKRGKGPAAQGFLLSQKRRVRPDS